MIRLKAFLCIWFATLFLLKCVVLFHRLQWTGGCIATASRTTEQARFAQAGWICDKCSELIVRASCRTGATHTKRRAAAPPATYTKCHSSGCQGIGQRSKYIHQNASTNSVCVFFSSAMSIECILLTHKSFYARHSASKCWLSVVHRMPSNFAIYNQPTRWKDCSKHMI